MVKIGDHPDPFPNWAQIPPTQPASASFSAFQLIWNCGPTAKPSS
jgi:hypothetical protein